MMVPTAAGRTPDDTREPPLPTASLLSTTGPNQPDPTLVPPLTLERHKPLAPPSPAPADPHPQEAADGAAWLRRHLQARQ